MPLLNVVRGLVGAVIELLAAGDMEGGARRFMDTVLGTDAWDEQLTPQDKRTCINNAPTFLDEERDPEAGTLDLRALARFSHPALLTVGSASPPLFPPVVGRVAEAIPGARQHTFEGVGHLPHQTHPAEFVDVVTSFVQSVGVR